MAALPTSCATRKEPWAAIPLALPPSSHFLSLMHTWDALLTSCFHLKMHIARSVVRTPLQGSFGPEAEVIHVWKSWPIASAQHRETQRSPLPSPWGRIPGTGAARGAVPKSTHGGACCCTSFGSQPLTKNYLPLCVMCVR